MDTTQKARVLAALTGFGDFAIRMRREGDWYCSLPRVEIKRGGLLESPTQSAPTPEGAIDAAFAQYANPSERVIVDAYGPKRREVQWNGYMWEDRNDR